MVREVAVVLTHVFFPTAGVLFQDLTVSGMGGVKTYIKTFPHAFLDIVSPIINLLPHKRNGEEVEILKDFRGLVKPGEMCLVLGRPGSGCTTFLKVMANQRHGYTSVDGEVMYGRFGAETFGKKYRGEAVYNQEGKWIPFLVIFCGFGGVAIRLKWLVFVVVGKGALLLWC